MHERTSPRSGRRARLTLVGVLALVLCLAACGGSSRRSKGSAPTGSTSPENVAFYYLPIRSKADVKAVGPVRLVVAGAANASGGGAGVVKAIHSTGAKAYIYQQTYWFPQNRSYQGLNMSRHPDWAFCSDGDQPTTASRDGQPWVFLDMNEKRVQLFLENRFKALKTAGWDGVFFDRGAVALGASTQDPPVWYKTSTCTQSPVHPDAAFADTWIDVSGLVKAAGLDLIQNYGISPFDSRAPMRPDPRDENCVKGVLPCRTLEDGWDHPNWVLDEAVAHPRDIKWNSDFAANLQNEQNANHPNSVIGLITVGTLGRDVSRQNVFFEWARVKLFDIPLGVSVWDRATACPNAEDGEPCRSLVTYPDLTSIVLGAPIDGAPQSARCASARVLHCVWSRRYQDGAMLVNVQDGAVNGFKLDLGTRGCRYVYDVWDKQPLAGNKCVDSVVLDLPAWSGRPLSYSTDPR